MENDRKAIAALLGMPEEQVDLDRFLYEAAYPDEIKAWRFIGKSHPQLRSYAGRLYYPPSALVNLLDLTMELLFRNRFDRKDVIPALLTNDTRFRKPVIPENELLIQVKLIRNYKQKIGIFAGAVVDRQGDIVAENISKGTIVEV
jgi:hypothetical protein